MRYIFYGINDPKSIMYLDADRFVERLFDITDGFSSIPALFDEWALLSGIYVEGRYSEFKSKIIELPSFHTLPDDIKGFFSDNVDDLSVTQRFELLMALMDLGGLINPSLDGIDPHEVPLHSKMFESYINGHADESDLEGLSRLSRGAYDDANGFKVALDFVVRDRESVLKVFATQNIKYANGTLNFDKIQNLLKAQFGAPWKGYVVFKGLLIDKLLSHTSSRLTSRPSTRDVGGALEKVVVDIYRNLGYIVSETSATGDFGVDVLAQSNIEKIGIQCKNYSGSVGVEAVMQAHSGGHYYGCSRFIVYSANGFTPAAVEMAATLKVELLIYKGVLGD
ncbi:restriction endonuclease [Pseudomonas fortuita]|uniref:restriction endonuclease n=1 Tax=Pseudomonas fortuita TaxID=3233375 RepID=UPI003C30527E